MKTQYSVEQEELFTNFGDVTPKPEPEAEPETEPEPECGFWDDAEVISSYTRAQAIDDGVLVDLSAIAPDICREHFKTPVACTNAMWAIIDKAIKNKKWMNDLNGVRHDIFWMSKVMAQEIDPTTRLFQVIIRGAGRKSKFVFKVVCGPGDTAEPVMTFMLRGED